MNPASSRPKRRRSYRKSGIYTLKRAVLVLGSRALPAGNTTLGRELRAWRDGLVADLGGPDAVSTQQVALIEKAVTQKLICDSLDAYVLAMGSLVDKRHRTMWPIVRERAAQVTLLQSLLRDLGLERRQKPVPSLAEYLAQRERERAARARGGLSGPGRAAEVHERAAGVTSRREAGEVRPLPHGAGGFLAVGRHRQVLRLRHRSRAWGASRPPDPTKDQLTRMTKWSITSRPAPRGRSR